MHKLALILPLLAAPTLSAVPPHPIHTPPKPATAPLRAALPPAPPLCLNPNKDYNANYLSGRAVLIKAMAGKKPRATLKADTNCIGIDGTVHIKLDAKGACLVAGDALKLRRNGDYGWQTCQITQITPVTVEK